VLLIRSLIFSNNTSPAIASPALDSLKKSPVCFKCDAKDFATFSFLDIMNNETKPSKKIIKPSVTVNSKVSVTKRSAVIITTSKTVE